MEKPLDQNSSILDQVSSHPLFSILTTFFFLNLIYLPNLLHFFFSPVVIATSLILTTLLYFGSSKPEPYSKDNTKKIPETRNEQPPISDHETTESGRIEFCEKMVEWSSKGGPLEVIYEEGEEDNDEDDCCMEYPRLKRNYMDKLDYFGYCSSSDSDTESEKSSICFKWDEEEEEMIEIALEEDSLIEIDLTSCR